MLDDFYKIGFFVILYLLGCLFVWIMVLALFPGLNKYALRVAAWCIVRLDYRTSNLCWYNNDDDNCDLINSRIQCVFERLCSLCLTGKNGNIMSDEFREYVNHSGKRGFLLFQVIGYWYYMTEKDFLHVHSYQQLSKLSSDQISQMVHIVFPDVHRYTLIDRSVIDNKLVVRVVVNYDKIADLTYAADEVVFCDLDEPEGKQIQTVLSVSNESAVKYRKWLLANGCTKLLDDNMLLT